MKKIVKGMVIGVVMGSILTASVSVFAAEGRTIEVFDNVKRIVVNQVQKPMDPNNKAFAYNGTTYVPLRFIADSLNVEVDWDGSTGTVFIGKTDNVAAKHWVTDLPSINHSSAIENSHGDLNRKIEDNAGNAYSNYLSIYRGYSIDGAGYAEYALNGQYKSFKAKLGLPKDRQNEQGDRIVRIYLDDKLTLEKTLQAGALLTDINIDLTNAQKIRFELGGECYGTNVGFFNGEFLK